MEDHDFLDDIGEGAFYSDEENRVDGEDLTPEDHWEREFENID